MVDLNQEKMRRRIQCYFIRSALNSWKENFTMSAMFLLDEYISDSSHFTIREGGVTRKYISLSQILPLSLFHSSLSLLFLSPVLSPYLSTSYSIFLSFRLTFFLPSLTYCLLELFMVHKELSTSSQSLRWCVRPKILEIEC